jgi:hypothetical protein
MKVKRNKAMRKAVGILAILVAHVGFASVALFDFETEESRRTAPNIRNSDGMVVVATNSMAPSGSYALHVSKPNWHDGMKDKRGVRFALKPPITDWRGYDRLVIDLYNDGPSGDWLYIRAVGPDDDWEEGLFGRISLPAYGYSRWVVPLKWPKGFDVSNVTRMLVNSSSMPKGIKLSMDGFRLLKPGEPLPEPVGELFSRELMPRYQRRITELEQLLEEAHGMRRHDAALVKFRAACEKAGTRFDGFCVGKTSSAVQILPRDDFSAVPANDIKIRLARNEWEAVQLVIVPHGSDLKNAKVSLSDLHSAEGEVFSATNMQADVVGFVRTSRPCYPVKTLGWWPDPILGFLDVVDIKVDDAQSFYLRVKCPKGQNPGVYTGTVAISADGMKEVKIPFSLRVNSFELPDGSLLPLLISFKPTASARILTDDGFAKVTKDRNSPINIWRRHNDAWTDFFTDYKIVREHLYARPPWEPDFKTLERLKSQGKMGFFNLGCWKPVGNGPQALEEWREVYLPGLKRNYEKAKALGILEWACFYGADEIHPGSFKNVRAAAAEIRQMFPDIPIATTAFDNKYGIEGSLLSDITWFCPKVSAHDPKQAAKARAEGKQVWWYTCNIPKPPYPTSYIETPVIVTRLLMGAMTAKYRPDGYLYYSISHWSSIKPITEGPYTDWQALSLPPDFNGDGSWVCVGPDGIPLSTLRLENFRDGLEDFAYVKLLEARGEKVEVPETIVKSVTEYTFDADLLRKWRETLADRLENLSAK